MFVRLTIQEATDGFRATLSRRDDDSKATIGQPETFAFTAENRARADRTCVADHWPPGALTAQRKT